MTAPNEAVTADLLTSCDLLAHLVEQYRVDRKVLKYFGLKWTANLLKKMYKGAESRLDSHIGRLLFYDVDPEYNAGDTKGSDSVTEILDRDQALVQAALDQFYASRKSAWDSLADYLPDIYEHTIHELECQLKHLEREMNLIKMLGEAGYISSRLADGSDSDSDKKKK